MSNSLDLANFRKQSPLERYRTSVDEFIQDFIKENVDKAESMISYHFGFKDRQGSLIDKKSEGKFMRPSLCLLTVEAIGGEWEKAIPAAAAIELFHNFTLIIDDIQDEDMTRHGKPTVWSNWGKAQAINAGITASYISSLAMLGLTENGYSNETVLIVQRILTEIGIEVIDGQIRDIDFEKRLDISVTEY